MIDGRGVAGIIVAAGSSRRMGFDKLLHPIEGLPVLLRAVAALDACPYVDRLVVVTGAQRAAVAALLDSHPPEKPLTLVQGGAARAASVAAGVAACGDAGLIAIHDGARPFASPALVGRVIEAAARTGAAAPALPVRDTIKREAGGLVAETVPRQGLMAMQTPQVFDRTAYAGALAAIPQAEYERITDDCMVMERAGQPVALVPGEEWNVKITTPGDLEGHPAAGRAAMDDGVRAGGYSPGGNRGGLSGRRFAGGTRAPAGPPGAEFAAAGRFAARRRHSKYSDETMRIGHGYDVHQLAPERALVLGGVTIPHEKGLLGHSDADVLLHAVMDALLGAAALGDIGRHFPDSDPAYAGANSLHLLEKTADILRRAGWRAANVDATLLCQAPHLAPHIPAMRRHVAAALGLPVAAVSVKATTEEGLGFTGAGQGIAAHAVVLLRAVRRV